MHEGCKVTGDNFDDQKKRGLAKMIAGGVLVLAGVLGFVFGRDIKQRVLRLSVLAISGVSIAGGAYLFIAGVDDFAFGQLDHYEIGGPLFQEIVSESPDIYKEELKVVFEQQPEIRRLHFKCGDSSHDFTVFNTAAGIVGVPGKSVVCDNGSKLLTYLK